MIMQKGQLEKEIESGRNEKNRCSIKTMKKKKKTCNRIDVRSIHN